MEFSLVLGFEVSTAVTTKKPSSGMWRRVNRRFFQHPSNTFLTRVISSALKMDASLSSEASVYVKPT
jgi:hypothetical protein